MKQELDDALCNKYPLIFAQRNWDKTDTCMCWGFDCGDGWYDLIDSLCRSLQDYSNAHRHEINQVVATQVKSKFGELRFYVEGGDDVTDWMISFAERLSSTIKE